MISLKMMSPEELKELIKNAEQEIKNRAIAQVEEKKEKVVIAIRELIAACRSAGVYSIGNIWWECEDCGEGSYYDILRDDVLKNVAELLGKK